MLDINDVRKRAHNDKAFEDQLKADPVQTLSSLATPVLENDPWVYRIVVSSLGLTVLASVLGAIALEAIGADEIPTLLTALGSAAVGALAGLLAPQPQRVKK
jgi:hypothetical protein